MHILSSFINNQNIYKLNSIIRDSVVIEDMVLYKYNSSDELDIISNEDNRSLESKEMFLRYAMNNNKDEFDEHIGSNKPYKFEISNPKDLSLRGVLITPIVSNDKRVGLLLLYKGIEHGINFTKKDKNKINSLTPLLIKSINQEIIQDTELLKYKIEKNSIFDNKAIEKRLEIESSSKKELEKVLKEYIQKDIKLSEINTQLNDELKRLQDENSKLKENISDIKDENLHLKSTIKEKNEIIMKYKNPPIKSIQPLKKPPTNFEYMEDNIEFLLKEFSSSFKGYHNAYIMFEIMIYAISSSKNMAMIDECIFKIKGLNELVHLFYTNTTIKINRDKFNIKKIFDNSLNNITFDKNLPTSLMIDTPKINSILYHIMEDLAIVKDDKQPINIDIKYDNQLLIININGKVTKDSSLLKSILKQTIGDSDKNKKGLNISSRLIKIIKGELDIKYDNKNYQYNISIPAKVLDLKFV